MSKYNLSVRKPEATSIGRLMAFFFLAKTVMAERGNNINDCFRNKCYSLQENLWINK